MNNFQSTDYNVLILLNQRYFELAKICLNSLVKNSDEENITKIYIADIGLNVSSVDELKIISQKIEILETGSKIASPKDKHTKEWVDAVCLKTEILLKLIRNTNNLPLVMMDTDLFIVKDFGHLFDDSKDIQICKRSEPVVRSDMIMNYIGSFLIVNNTRSVDFVEKWIVAMKKRIATKTSPAYETPALCEIVEQYSEKLNIGYIDEDEICCNNNYIEGVSNIIHMKSGLNSETTDLVSGRIKAVTNYNHEAILSVLDHRSLVSLCDFLSVCVVDEKRKNEQNLYDMRLLRKSYGYRLGQLLVTPLLLLKKYMRL